jgi:hypothetical protein
MPPADPAPLPPVPTPTAVLPPAEAGETTSEYRLVRIFSIVSGTAFALLTGAASAHLVNLSSDALAFVASAVTTVNGAVIAVYAVARSSRKKGTPG